MPQWTFASSNEGEGSTGKIKGFRQALEVV